MKHYTAPLARERAHGRFGLRGFSLTEVVLAAALGGLLFLLSLRFVTSVIGVSETTVEGSGSRQSSIAVGQQIERDLRAARACDPYALESVIQSIENDRMTFTSDVTGDGKVDLVRYALVNGVLQRGVTTGDGTCTLGAPPTSSYTQVANNLSPVDSSTPVFSASRPNPVSPDNPIQLGVRTPGTCSGVRSDECRATAVRIRVRAKAPDTPGVGTVLDTTYSINDGGPT